MPISDAHLKKVLDDILRDVVCDCGNYRHHGVQWMPEGSGEGLSVAVGKLRILCDVAATAIHDPEAIRQRLLSLAIIALCAFSVGLAVAFAVCQATGR